MADGDRGGRSTKEIDEGEWPRRKRGAREGSSKREIAVRDRGERSRSGGGPIQLERSLLRRKKSMEL
jgi:hypothetical protein